MILAHKIALDPTGEQCQFFTRAAGCARFTYNWALVEWEAQYRAGAKPMPAKLKKQFNAIKREQFPWIYDSPKDANQQVFSQLGTAFKNFFERRAEYPTFKKKGKSKDSFYISNDKFEINGKRVKLPKIGWIKMREALRFSGKILSATISRTAQRWFISVQVEVEQSPSPSENQAGVVGVALGVKHLATLSTREHIEEPKPLRKLLKKLARLNRSFHRKKKGSANRRKAREKLARLYARIANIRQDALHKLSHHLAAGFEVVVLEDLNVKGMVKNRRLSRAISDMSLGEFRRQCEYKSALYDAHLVLANRWFPSSKMCRICGVINEALTLSDRVFVCESCGHEEDRDEHAALNLEAYPRLVGNHNVCGLPSSGLMLQPSGKTEQVEAEIQGVQLGLF